VTVHAHIHAEINCDAQTAGVKSGGRKGGQGEGRGKDIWQGHCSGLSWELNVAESPDSVSQVNSCDNPKTFH